MTQLQHRNIASFLWVQPLGEVQKTIITNHTLDIKTPTANDVNHWVLIQSYSLLVHPISFLCVLNNCFMKNLSNIPLCWFDTLNCFVYDSLFRALVGCKCWWFLQNCNSTLGICGWCVDHTLLNCYAILHIISTHVWKYMTYIHTYTQKCMYIYAYMGYYGIVWVFQCFSETNVYTQIYPKPMVVSIPTKVSLTQIDLGLVWKRQEVVYTSLISNKNELLPWFYIKSSPLLMLKKTCLLNPHSIYNHVTVNIHPHSIIDAEFSNSC